MSAFISLTALAEILGGEVHRDHATMDSLFDPTNVTVHSEFVRPQGIFFALGGRRDGHEFVRDALANGAGCAVVEARAQLDGVSGPLIAVERPLESLQRLALWYRMRLRCPVVAIVGSLGKTTTKDALLAALSGSVRPYANPGSYNSAIGVPLAILGCPENAEMAIIEAAATEPGEMSVLAEIVRASHVLLTNLGDRYRAWFASDEGRARELLQITKYIDPAGWILLGESGPAVQAALLEGVHAITRQSAEYPSIECYRLGSSAYQLTVKRNGASEVNVRVLTASSWLVDDVELALAAATLLGARIGSFEYTPTSSDLQTWRSPVGVTLLRSVAVDDAMAWRATVQDALSTTETGRRTFIVLSDAARQVSPQTVIAAARTLAHSERAMVFVPDGNLAALFRVHMDLSSVRQYRSDSEVCQALLRECQSGDVVAVFSARGDLIEGVSRNLLEAMSPTRLYINLPSIASNVRALRQHVGAEVKLMAVVKAAAYGTSAVELARHLERMGVDAFAVSSADEGAALRRGGVGAPVLVLLITPDELMKAVRYGLTPCVHSQELVNAVRSESGIFCGVHVEVDTGMHRTGLSPDEAQGAIQSLLAAGVKVQGLMTHLAVADDPAQDDVTLEQIRVFDEVVEYARRVGATSLVRHVLATAGAIRFPEYAYDMIRVGLGFLGIYPSPACNSLPLSPSLALVSRLIESRHLEAGVGVGYGLEFRADRPMTIGVVQIGYYDGLFRSFSGSGSVAVGDCMCRVVGRISMDSMTIDLSHCPSAEVGQDVLIFGRHRGAENPIELVAEAMQTIPYEVISGLGARVQRIFVQH